MRDVRFTPNVLSASLYFRTTTHGTCHAIKVARLPPAYERLKGKPRRIMVAESMARPA
jgi:hypothetical protein